MLPLISIIIPAYNSQDTIKRCIESAQNQTIKDIEIIVINDGSTDNTQQIVEDMVKEDDRIILINQENAGQGYARNAGIDIARGTYIGFADSDDTIENNMYEKMLEQMNKNHADVVECNIRRIYVGIKHPDNILLPLEDETVQINDHANYFAHYLFTAKHSYGCCNKLFNRSLLDNNHIRFYSNKEVYAEDLLFNLDVALAMKKIVFMKEPLSNYFQQEGSHSRTNDLNKTSKLHRLFDLFSEHAKKAGLYDTLKHEIAKLAVLIIMLNATQALNLEGGKKEIKRIMCQKDMKEYFILAGKSMPNSYQRLLMWSLRYMPFAIRFAIMKFYYTRWDK